MGMKLWGEKIIGEDTPGMAKSRKTKQKAMIHSEAMLVDLNFSDCENVRSCYCNFWRVLVAIPYLLHVLLLQPLHHEGLVHPSHVPGLLLAGHGQLLCQPHGLLCHEQEVMII